MSDQTPPPPPPPPAPAPSRERKWLPAFGVLLVMAFVSLGGYVFAGEPGEVADPAPELGDPIDVTEGVTLRPARGWEVGEPVELTLEGGTELSGIRLNGGIATLDAVAAPGAPPAPLDAWRIYMEQGLAPQAEQLRTVDELEPFTTDAGLEGVRGYYVGVFAGVASPIEGEVSAIVLPSGIGVIADGWAPEGQLGGSIESIRTMVRALGGA